MSQPHADHTIDRILTALRDTPAPTGLEARIAHRLLQAQTMPSTPKPSPFVTFLLSCKKVHRIALTAATALAIAIAIPIAHHQLAAGSWPTESQPSTITTTLSATTHPTQTLSFRPNRDGFIVPRSGETRSSSPNITTPDDPDAIALADPDAIALAETLAPSQPIPSQQLTPQERLLQNATRQGHPLEVAELELARAPFHRAAVHARELLTFAQVAHGLLAPLAAAESIAPTPPTPETQPTPQPAAPPDAPTDPPSPR